MLYGEEKNGNSAIIKRIKNRKITLRQPVNDASLHLRLSVCVDTEEWYACRKNERAARKYFLYYYCSCVWLSPVVSFGNKWVASKSKKLFNNVAKMYKQHCISVSYGVDVYCTSTVHSVRSSAFCSPP